MKKIDTSSFNLGADYDDEAQTTLLLMILFLFYLLKKTLGKVKGE